MKSKLYWIEGPWRGRLAIFPRPRGGDWLEDEVLGWKDAGLKTLVSALTPEEVAELDLGNEEALCRAHGLEFISFPVEDRGVPTSMASARQLVERLENSLTEGESVGIHCRQGIGRSSLLAACTLVMEGADAKQAFDSIGRVRGCPVPDTTEQCDWVAQYAGRQRVN